MVAATALKTSLSSAKMLLRFGGAIVLMFAVGFVWFVGAAQREADAPLHTEGLVVLTGGAGRVETGLHLLAAGRADQLLVSGVAHSADLPSLARLAGVDPAPFATRVTLGHAASTTRGNAAEAATWARVHDIHTMIVITGYYHMPRALAELSRECPDVTLFRLPVFPPAMRHWNMMGLRLLMEEYVKYLLVLTGVDYVLPPDHGQPPAILQVPRA